MIFDLLLVLCVAVFIAFGIARGGVKTLCGLIATALAFLISMFCSALIATWVYNSFVSQRIIETVVEKISLNSSQAIHSLQDIFPDFINGMIEANGIDIDAIAASASGSELSVAKAVETAVAPYIILFFTVVLLVVVFILLRVIFSIFIRLINRASHLPVLHQLNRALGFVCGLCQGIIVVLLLTAIVQSAVSGNAEGTGIFTDSYINSSFIFKYFYSGKILDFIIHIVS